MPERGTEIAEHGGHFSERDLPRPEHDAGSDAGEQQEEKNPEAGEAT